jgi:hypothetical protein
VDQSFGGRGHIGNDSDAGLLTPSRILISPAHQIIVDLSAQQIGRSTAPVTVKSTDSESLTSVRDLTRAWKSSALRGRALPIQPGSETGLFAWRARLYRRPPWPDSRASGESSRHSRSHGLRSRGLVVDRIRPLLGRCVVQENRSGCSRARRACGAHHYREELRIDALAALRPDASSGTARAF